MNQQVQPTEYLSEDDAAEEPEPRLQREDGLQDGDPFAASLAKLTSIAGLLAADKVKRASASKLEVALDSGAGSSSDHPLHGTGKKAAATCPEEFIRRPSRRDFSAHRAPHERGPQHCDDRPRDSGARLAATRLEHMQRGAWPVFWTR